MKKSDAKKSYADAVKSPTSPDLGDLPPVKRRKVDWATVWPLLLHSSGVKDVNGDGDVDMKQGVLDVLVRGFETELQHYKQIVQGLKEQVTSDASKHQQMAAKYATETTEFKTAQERLAAAEKALQESKAAAEKALQESKAATEKALQESKAATDRVAKLTKLLEDEKRRTETHFRIYQFDKLIHLPSLAEVGGGTSVLDFMERQLSRLVGQEPVKRIVRTFYSKLVLRQLKSELLDTKSLVGDGKPDSKTPTKKEGDDVPPPPSCHLADKYRKTIVCTDGDAEWRKNLKKESAVFAFDSEDWFKATVIDAEVDKVKVHYDTCDNIWNEWFYRNSPLIATKTPSGVPVQPEVVWNEMPPNWRDHVAVNNHVWCCYQLCSGWKTWTIVGTRRDTVTGQLFVTLKRDQIQIELSTQDKQIAFKSGTHKSESKPGFDKLPPAWHDWHRARHADAKQPSPDSKSGSTQAPPAAAVAAVTFGPLGHFLLTGPPGTGKTTFARLIRDILLKLELVNRNFVCTNGNDLTDQYVGHTKEKVHKLFEKARGGVLFIDEASGVRNAEDTFGGEALDAIMSHLAPPDGPPTCVVMLAGYESEIDKLLKTDDGLERRFATRLRFESYTPEELCEIVIRFFADKCEHLVADPDLRDNPRAPFLIMNDVLRKLTPQVIERQNASIASRLYDQAENFRAERLLKQMEEVRRDPELIRRFTRIDLLHAVDAVNRDAAAHNTATAVRAAAPNRGSAH